MSAQPITRDIAADFEAAALAQFNAKVNDAPDSFDRRVVGLLLDASFALVDVALRVRDPQTLVDSKVLSLGPTVYVPATAGHEVRLFALAHQLQYVVQWWQHKTTWAALYIMDEGRALLCGEAFTTTAEMFWLLKGKKGIPRPEAITAALPVLFALDKNEVDTATLLAEQGATTCCDSGPTTAVGVWVAKWFATNYPECLSDDARALLVKVPS